jgi:8-oxo-dGTP pyrophosphatase MutT (NUDIX family)
MQILSYEGYQSILSQDTRQEYTESGTLPLVFAQDGELFMLLTERPKKGISHSGRVVVPGGRKDSQDKDTAQTAIREVREEIGLSALFFEIYVANPIKVLTTTKKERETKVEVRYWRMNIYPAVGKKAILSRVKLNHDEVAAIKLLPLKDLFQALSKFLGDTPSEEPRIVISQTEKAVPVADEIVNHYVITVTEPDGSVWTVQDGTAYFLINFCKEWEAAGPSGKGYETLLDFYRCNPYWYLKAKRLGKRFLRLMLDWIKPW